MECSLVAFERQDIIGPLIDDLTCDLFLTAHGIDSNDAAFDVQKLKKLRNGGDHLSSVFSWPKAIPFFVAHAPTM